MASKAKELIQPEVLLAADENEIIAFMNESHTGSGRFDVSRIANLDAVPAAQREEIFTKLINASTKINPLDTGKLDQALGRLEIKLAKGERTAFAFYRQERDATQSPPPTPDATSQQTIDANKLTEAGGRLAVPLEHLLDHHSPMKKEHLARMAMWLDLPKKNEAGYDDVLPLATRQLEHWTAFKQFWQWGNRGTMARRKGFDIFLAAMKKKHLEKGHIEMVADEESFTYMVLGMWERQQPLHTASPSNTETLTSYSRAMTDRLNTHGFSSKKPFKLLADPRKQDAWTTWIEYLNYIYWQLDGDTESMESAEPRFRQAMDDLLCTMARPSPLSELHEKTWAHLKKICDRVNKIREGSEAYLKYEKRVHRGQLRANWVIEEIARIEKENEENVPSLPNGRQLRKRKSRHHGNDGEKEMSAQAAPKPLKRSRTAAATAAETPPSLRRRSRRSAGNDSSDVMTR